MSIISDRLKHLDSSDFRDAFHKQQHLKDPVDLSVGVPEELTPEHIKKAGIEAITNDRTAYTPANGLPELRDEISKKLLRENKISATPEMITVVPGLTTGQLLIYMAIVDPGDEIVVIDPYYPPYTQLAAAVGANVLLVNSLPTFHPDIPEIEASITNRTKAIVINSPNNPTGAVYSESDLRKIAEIADRHGVLVISDEIYEHFNYESKHFSIGSIYENTLTLNGFSKAYAMTGWRLGYISGPQELIEAINEIQQYSVFASSTIAQHAALSAIKSPPELTKRYTHKRDVLKAELESLGYEINGMEGAYYAFVKAPNDMQDFEFVQKAADHNLIVVPGRAFSSRTGYFRLSYGAPMSEIRAGLKILRQMHSNEE